MGYDSYFGHKRTPRMVLRCNASPHEMQPSKIELVENGSRQNAVADPTIVQARRSRVSRTLSANSLGKQGLRRKFSSATETPWRTMASSAYPDT